MQIEQFSPPDSEIVIKVFDKDGISSKRVSIEPVNPLKEKRSNLLKTFNDGKAVKIQGDNMLGISYSTLEGKGLKKMSK